MSTWILVYADDLQLRTERMQVSGGWLYRTRVSVDGVAMAFVPDPNVPVMASSRDAETRVAKSPTR
jgi:hypothetical protein